MSLHKLQEFLEKATKDSDISEDAYVKIGEYLKGVNCEINNLKNQVNILNNEARLDVIELLMEETKECMDNHDFECVYQDLCYEQFKKLRYPFE